MDDHRLAPIPTLLAALEISIAPRKASYHVRSAESLAIGQLPDRARKSIKIRHSVQIHILEGLRHESACLGIIAIGRNRRRIDIYVQVAVEVDLDLDLGREVELAVQGAGAVARLNRGRGRELVDPSSAGGGPVEAVLDAVTCALHGGEGEVYFGDDAGDVEALDIADAAMVGNVEVSADAWLHRIVAASLREAGRDTDGQHADDQDECW